MDLNSDRGIFNVSKVRSIIDKLLYNDFYDIIDKNMSDSNVGARKDRNIRDNLFVAYAVINNAIFTKTDVDITLFDISQCFDSQWYQETMNDMWNVSVKDDKFALMAKMNETVDIAVKIGDDQTDRFKLHQIEQ